MAAEAGDSSHEVINHETTNNEYDSPLGSKACRSHSARNGAGREILAMWSINAACPGFAQEPGLPGFQSPAEASQILFQAVQRDDAAAVAMILGGPSELASSGDGAQDKLDREMFVQKYQEMHRLGRDADGSETLYIGAENWPFPIPLVYNNGAWHFDPVAGLREVLFRRIGENELTAIAICHELVAAEKQIRADPKAASQADNPLASVVSYK